MKKLGKWIDYKIKEYGVMRSLCYVFLFLAYLAVATFLPVVIGGSVKIFSHDAEAWRILNLLAACFGVMSGFIAISIILMIKALGWKESFTKINFYILITFVLLFLILLIAFLICLKF